MVQQCVFSENGHTKKHLLDETKLYQELLSQMFLTHVRLLMVRVDIPEILNKLSTALFQTLKLVN